MLIHIKLKDSQEIGVTVNVDTLDISIDMLRRALMTDLYTRQCLGLGPSIKQFHIGVLKERQFVPIDFSTSLSHVGIRSGDTLFVHMIR